MDSAAWTRAFTRRDNWFDDGADEAKPPLIFPVILKEYQETAGGDRRPVFRLGRRPLSLAEVRRTAFPQGGPWRGIFVQGSEAAARQVVRHARLGLPGRPERHGSGLTHLHAWHPRLGRSDHIFYGSARPSGDFADDGRLLDPADEVLVDLFER